MTYLIQIGGVLAPAGNPVIQIPSPAEITLFNHPSLVDWRRATAPVESPWLDMTSNNPMLRTFGSGNLPIQTGGLNAQPYFDKSDVAIFTTATANQLIPSGDFSLVLIGSPSSAQVSYQSIFCSRNDGDNYLQFGFNREATAFRVRLGRASQVLSYTPPSEPLADAVYACSYTAATNTLALHLNGVQVASRVPADDPLLNRWLHLFGTQGTSSTASSFRGRVYDVMVFSASLADDASLAGALRNYVADRYGI